MPAPPSPHNSTQDGTPSPAPVARAVSGNIHQAFFPILALGLVALVAFSFSFTPFRASQDDFWHLKAGMLQIEHGFPIHGPEPFSYCDPEATWHNHEWLAQRWFYRVFASAGANDFNGGLIRLIFFKSLIVCATFMIVAWAVARRGTGWAIAALCAVVAAEISRRTIYVRPPVFSYLLMALFLLVLHEWKAGRLRLRWLWLLPPIAVLWANLHGMVPLAIVCVGAYAAGEWIEALLKPGLRASFSDRLQSLAASATVRAMTLLLIGVGLATLVQPSGIGLYSLAGKFTKDPLLQITIAEMLPAKFFLQGLPGGGLTFVPGFATFWFALAAVATLWLWNRGRLQHWADAQLILFFAYQGISHWRLLPLFAIASAPALGWLIYRALARLGYTERPVEANSASEVGPNSPTLSLLTPRTTRTIAVAAVVLGVIYTTIIVEHRTFLQRNVDLAQGRAIENPMDYPVPVVRALLATRPPGQLYSPSNYCGWFMWWLAPEAYRTFADNRFDHFGSRFLHDELVMRMALMPGIQVVHRSVEKSWLDTINHYGIKTLAIERSTRLHQRLRTHTAFQPAYIYLPPNSTNPDAGWTIWVTTEDAGTTPAQALVRRFQNENPSAPHPHIIEGYKPQPNSPELPPPGEGE